MASAARPGTRPPGVDHEPPEGRKRKARPGFIIKMVDETWKLYIGDMGAEDRNFVRNQTGRSWGSYIEETDLDSVCVIWMMARRKAGERKLQWRQATKEFPSPDEIEDMGDDFDFDWLEDLDADAVEEDDAHPLPNAAS